MLHEKRRLPELSFRPAPHGEQCQCFYFRPARDMLDRKCLPNFVGSAPARIPSATRLKAWGEPPFSLYSTLSSRPMEIG